MKKLIFKIKVLIAILSSRKMTVRPSLNEGEKKYTEHLWRNFSKENFRPNKRVLETVARQYGITNQNDVKELTELFLVNECREIANTYWNNTEGAYEKIIELYNQQVTLSHRTSQSILLQQYSTPAPIAYLCGLFCSGSNNYDGRIFEPSAGNGMLTIVFDPKNTVVNEIDDKRYQHLSTQEFYAVTAMDASKPFTMFNKTFNCVITNPPFGSIDATEIDGVKFKTLDHVMAIYALQTMTDSGRAAIIVGGHTDYDSLGRIQSGKNRIFLSYLWKYYNVADYINIDGELYSRMGTSFNVRVILIDGRKEKPGGYPPIFDGELLTNMRYNPSPIRNYYELYERFLNSL